MALQASGGNPPTNSISFSQIVTEFGQNSSSSLGGYRMNNLNIGDLTEVSLDRDGCGISASGSIPVDQQTIKFSDFFSSRLNVIVDCHSGSNENRVNAKNDKYNASTASGNYTVVGPGSKPSNTSGKKIIIHVNKTIGSLGGSTSLCALRTGTWNNGTDLRVEVGNNGLISGAGGNGGEGAGSERSDGAPGFDGSSGLGIEYTGGTTFVTTEGNGRIVGGGGGGGGGGSAYGKTERSPKPTIRAEGGGGGGGAGIPAGDGGAPGSGGGAGSQSSNATGSEGTASEGGNGGEGSERNQGGEGNFTRGGDGANGGDLGAEGGTGSGGSAGGGEWEWGPVAYGGGSGGEAGDAIRRVVGAPAPDTSGGASTTGATNAVGVA